MLPRAVNPDVFRRGRLYTKAVDDVGRKYESQLRAIFDFYAATGIGDDPSEAPPVLEALESFGWLQGGARVAIINTHHHWDHTGGNLALRSSLLALGAERVSAVRIFGNEDDRERYAAE